MGINTSWHRLIIALVALAACLTSVGNGFAYDDIPINATNERAHTL